MTLESAAAAHLRLVVGCKGCGHRSEPNPAEQVRWYGPATPVPEWRPAAGLLAMRQPQCIHGGCRDVAVRPTWGRSILRDDLLDPYACVDWAVGQLDVFNERIARWIDSRPYAVTGNKDPQSGEDVWDVREVEPIPRLINAEAGAIINSLRSSLDLLANKLAERNGQIGKRDVIFQSAPHAPPFKTADVNR
jgi:hypothetical protein